MDIYRKELNQIYASQLLDLEKLEKDDLEEARSKAATLAEIGRGATVITDASCDRCYVYGGSLGQLMGFFQKMDESSEESSSDEDAIYSLIHPEDLVDKRLLEYEFFRFINDNASNDILHFKATCTIRMRDTCGNYRLINNTTRVIALSPAGKMWLILCTYDLSPCPKYSGGIEPSIVNTSDGKILSLDFGGARSRILSKREKEILLLVQEGLPSKIIADRLNISINTVNRHRQNIISKLSVHNSHEAVRAALSMRIL